MLNHQAENKWTFPEHLGMCPMGEDNQEMDNHIPA